MIASANEMLTFTIGESRELASRDDGLHAVGIPANDVAAARIARADQAVAHAIRSVTVPSDLRRKVLDRIGGWQKSERRRIRLRRFAVALTTCAAGLLLLAWIHPFGKPAFDAEVVASSAASLYKAVLADQAPLQPGQGDGAWPAAILKRTCMGYRDVVFLGQRVRAYELAAGRDRAVLIVIPESRFPYQRNAQRIAIPHSTHQVEVHCFTSSRQVCLLIVGAGVDHKQFEAVGSIT